MRSKITLHVVEHMRAGEVRWDTEVRGFGVRRQRARGWARYVLRYERFGRTRWITIGAHGSPWTLDDARAEARRLLVELDAGRDPAIARETVAGIPTVAAFAEKYLADHVKPKKASTTHDAYAAIIRRRILPEFGSRRLDTLSSAEVTSWHNRIGEAAPTEANRAIAVLSAMFRMARRWRVYAGNPARDLERFPEGKRERFLTPDETARLGEAIRRLAEKGIPRVDGASDKFLYPSPRMAAALRLILLTGARMSEVTRLRWSSVDPSRRLLVLPAGTRGTKRRRSTKVIRLNRSAVAILEHQPRLAGNPYVFPARGERGSGGLPITESALEICWRKVRASADIPDVRLHDLRHSFASTVLGGGATLPMLGALLGHTNPGTTQRYAHLAHDQLADVAESAGKAVDAALSKTD